MSVHDTALRIAAAARALASAAVPNTRQVTVGAGLSGGGSLTSDIAISLANTGVTSGTYGGGAAIPVLQINSAGRITAATTRPVVMLNITRAQIPSNDIQVKAFAVTGFSTDGDLGAGAIYMLGTSSGPMAIQDSTGRWFNLYTKQGVRAGWCGVKCDGTTDDTAAFRVAWDTACTSSNPLLLLEPGTMRIATATTAFNAVSGLRVIGAGKYVSIVKWIEDSLGQLFGREGAASGRVSDVLFKDFAVIGTHGDSGDYTSAGRYPFLAYKIDGLRFEGIRVEKSRVMAVVARQSTDVSAFNCAIRYCARDGINFADCDNYDISHNLIEFVDDDAIAAHNDVSDRIDRRGVISNNRVRFAQGIKALGAVTVSVTGNTLEFVMGQGISVNTFSTGTEGRNAASGDAITGNTIKNCIDRQAVDGLNAGAPYIIIGGRSAQAGGLSAIPGENVTGTASVINPYPYFQGNDGGVTTDPVPGSIGINIAGNTCVRDIPTGVSLSSLGYGVFYTRNGPVDIASIPASAVRVVGIQMDGLLKAVNVASNTFHGISFAMFLNAGSKVAGRATGNEVYDCYGGIVCSGTNHHSFVSQGNTYDLDPYVQHSGRGANGTWTSETAGPTALLLQGAYGISSRYDTFRNCSRISEYALEAADGGNIHLEVVAATLECQPTATFFQTTNKGIGECPRAGPSFWYKIVDSDPASSTFGATLNNCARQGANPPSYGFYVRGMFVQNTGYSISSGKVLLGWVRLTNGSAHVSGTDWSPVYATTS